MVYIRKRMNWKGFMEHIKVGLIAALVIAALLLIIGGLVQSAIHKDRIWEQNLYWALQGKEVKDELAMKTAAMARQIYRDGIVITEPEGWKQFKKLIWADTNSKTPYTPNSLRFAFNHWDKVVSIIENPETEVLVKIPAWPDFWKFIGLISWAIIALFLSISYIWVTANVHYRSTAEERRYNKAWQYPWNKFWAWLAIPAMLPYIIFVQPGAGIYFLVRTIGGADVRERREKEATQKINFQQAAGPAQSLAALERSRSAWVQLQKKSLKEEKRLLETRLEDQQSRLSSLGQEIENCQRSLAETRAELPELEKDITAASAKNQEELEKEFNGLLTLPGLKAIEVSNREIRIYTETVFIPYQEAVYEIGDFLITIVLEKPNSILIKNLRNTSGRGLDHPFSNDNKWTNFCFGRNAEAVQNSLRRKNFYPLIVFILLGLKTPQGDEGGLERIKRWKKVEEQGGEER